MSGYTIVSLCQDTQLCLGLLLLFKHFSFFSFFKAFSFYFLFSIIEIFQMPSTENYIQVQNSVVCLEGTLLCPAAFLRSWFFVFFQSFPLPFPLLAKVFSFQLISFFLSFEILRNDQFPKIYDALLKLNKKTSLKQFFKGVVHEQPWYTIVWFVWGYTIVSSCFLRSCFFSIISFTFSFAS